MKKIKYLSDLTELSIKELNEAYKRYEPSINLLRITSLNFWIIALISGVIGFLYFMEEPLWNYQAFFQMLTIVSSYYVWDRLAYKKGFIEWYEAGWSDWVKECIKHERNLSNKEFEVMEDMDNSAKYWI